MAFTSRKAYSDLDELVANRRGEHLFLLVLDGVEDPQNLGALLRSANGAGVDGVIIPERRAAGITGAVVKASAGASEHLAVARVVNIARTLEELKDRNVWTVGLDERAPQSYDELDYNMDCALVLGAEGKGLHELVRKKCDLLVSIPMMGSVASLNVSVAGGIVMYEVLRQRRAKLQAPIPGGAGLSDVGEHLTGFSSASGFCAFVPGCWRALPLAALDRDAFTFTHYSLTASIRPAEHDFEAHGTLELRNDSASPQRQLALQISSSLSWKQILLADGQPVSYITQNLYLRYRSHRRLGGGGGQPAARPVPPRGSVKLEVSYAGEIDRDSGRLTRIGAPESHGAGQRLGRDRGKFRRGARAGLRHLVSGLDRGRQLERRHHGLRRPEALEAAPAQTTLQVTLSLASSGPGRPSFRW